MRLYGVSKKERSFVGPMPMELIPAAVVNLVTAITGDESIEVSLQVIKLW
jgi:hypothetical protein